jgi:hypothetical protein
VRSSTGFLSYEGSTQVWRLISLICSCPAIVEEKGKRAQVTAANFT